MPLTPFPEARFNNLRGLERPHSYTCAWCATDGMSSTGTVSNGEHAHPFRPQLMLELQAIRVDCPKCARPTYFEQLRLPGVSEDYEPVVQSPPPLPDEDLPFLPEAVQSFYEDARRCFAVKAFAGTEQLCRKLMLHIIDTSNARESSKATSRNTNAFMEDARARIVMDEASLELTPATAANAEASLVLTASMLRMLYRPPEATE
ncbi:hypothetical protein ACLEPN_16695 [Myxococcus sp. 1LA]